jgi:hypothetical protein
MRMGAAFKNRAVEPPAIGEATMYNKRENDVKVEECVNDLQDTLFRAATKYGPGNLLTALAIIIGASLRALIRKSLMTRLTACRFIDRIEKTTFGQDDPPPGAEIEPQERRAA